MLTLNTDVFKYISLFPVTILFIVLLAVVTKRKKQKPRISKELLEKRIQNFSPKPLIDNQSDDLQFDNIEKLQPDESDPNCLNLVKINYYAFINDHDIEREAEKAIRKYGVGSCGPRGFYGTIDIHLLLEDRLAKFMGLEEAVLYSYGFSTIASAIGAYCKKTDYIFVDEKISFASKQGLLAAKGKEIYFNHNDMKNLEEKMKAVNELEKKEENKKKIFRKFLIVEGIYELTGSICPLPTIMALCKKYKVRLFIDETYSFGILGKTGRGVTEHFGVDRKEVDMIMASLEGALGSIGGFCVGASVIIEHQRLSGLGYCFSASLPPFLCQTSLCALDILEKHPDYISKLQQVSVLVQKAISEIEDIEVLSDDISPVKVFTLTKNANRENIIEKMQNVYNYCTQRGLFLHHIEEALKFHCNVKLSPSDIDTIKNVISNAVKDV